ncbi:C2H2-type DNA- Zinc finger protein [Tubulinosema ratisbonensis]|uniref:C2H2-type DNA-Zinc finger protein n=1 Tax=Tubulinosema ratisbonensis TaxID=291195 RepID=A0A437AMA8_9MICR|nr:C2H2-type DNA- Zinc finger protein [Tubulinosema ratisbonensis]
MSYKDEKKTKRILEKGERETIEFLQMQHMRDKTNFRNRMHTMHPEQVRLEYLLLNMEEEVYFRNKNYGEQEVNEIEEFLFINSQSCCNLKFNNFNEWAQHLNTHCNQFVLNKKEENHESVKIPMTEIEVNEEIKSDGKTRMFKCEVSNCNKSYTSAYGLRYHQEKGHKEDEDVTKPFICVIDNCKKRYKNANGLKYHVLHSHK